MGPSPRLPSARLPARYLPLRAGGLMEPTHLLPTQVTCPFPCPSRSWASFPFQDVPPGRGQRGTSQQALESGVPPAGALTHHPVQCGVAGHIAQQRGSRPHHIRVAGLQQAGDVGQALLLQPDQLAHAAGHLGKRTSEALAGLPRAHGRQEGARNPALRDPRTSSSVLEADRLTFAPTWAAAEQSPRQTHLQLAGGSLSPAGLVRGIPAPRPP